MPAGPRADATEFPTASEVRALYLDLLDSWNERDAAGFAAHLAAESHVVGFDGSEMDGPAEVEAALHPIFAHHPTASYVAKVRGITMLALRVALLRSIAGMVPSGGTDLNLAVNAIQTMIARLDDGRWCLALFQTTPAVFHGRPVLVTEMTEELREVLRGR